MDFQQNLSRVLSVCHLYGICLELIDSSMVCIHILDIMKLSKSSAYIGHKPDPTLVNFVQAPVVNSKAITLLSLTVTTGVGQMLQDDSIKWSSDIWARGLRVHTHRYYMFFRATHGIKFHLLLKHSYIHAHRRHEPLYIFPLIFDFNRQSNLYTYR